MIDIPVFKCRYPPFKDVPDDTIKNVWELSQCFSAAAKSLFDCAQCGKQFEWLLLAHLLAILGYPAAGAVTEAGIVTSATVGSVSVSLGRISSSKSSFLQWLNKTPWGEILSALLGSISKAGPHYIGGSPEGRSFRKWGGRW